MRTRPGPSRSDITEQKTNRAPGPQDRATNCGDPWPRSYPSSRFLLSHFIPLKMSFLEENSGVKTDSEDWERDESQSCSEDPARSPLGPGLSLTSMSSAHSSPKVTAKAPEKFSIYDQDHKVLVLDCGILRAVPDRPYILPETFFVLASHLSSACEEKGSPILLAVSKGELCLCCEKDKGQSKPSLQLKKKKLTDLATEKEQARQPFIFYRAEVGSKNTLESVTHPGWFICTSCNSGEPVGMTDILGKREHTEFSFRRVHKAEMSPIEATE
uniref:Interleukin-1 n=2 Tax=Equus caballus TaxID=9796 RepID=A0A9L0RUP2_HORSE|nr:interleukin-37 isoform X1 [Equus caballus]XP_023474512.1 interleukin-37 isoform X1 [Equus caballus]